MNIFQWFPETFVERCRFSIYCFERDLTEIFDLNKLNKYIIIVIDRLEFDETFEHLWI